MTPETGTHTLDDLSVRALQIAHLGTMMTGPAYRAPEPIQDLLDTISMAEKKGLDELPAVFKDFWRLAMRDLDGDLGEVTCAQFTDWAVGNNVQGFAVQFGFRDGCVTSLRWFYAETWNEIEKQAHAWGVEKCRLLGSSK